ncbi:MAG TPA: hypothetical protein PKI11_07340 [Candidatus Hydrogenedentes bacterium]|nr:hypothetical protein [Candidatus Hydrogenedentota bacterium]
MAHQDVLWWCVVCLDLDMTIALVRMFGKTGLCAVVVLGIM